MVDLTCELASHIHCCATDSSIKPCGWMLTAHNSSVLAWQRALPDWEAACLLEAWQLAGTQSVDSGWQAAQQQTRGGRHLNNPKTDTRWQPLKLQTGDGMHQDCKTGGESVQHLLVGLDNDTHEERDGEAAHNQLQGVKLQTKAPNNNLAA